MGASNSKSIAELNQLAHEANRIKWPNLPDHARIKPAYKESTTNELTKTIITYITLKGGYAVRINTQGQYNEKLGQWTKSNTRKGTADIHACYHGRHISIEIKTGKDKMSEDQESTRTDVTKAGGLYILASCLDDVVKHIS